MSTTVVGLTSLLRLPIAFRFVFGSFVDGRATKRKPTPSV